MTLDTCFLKAKELLTKAFEKYRKTPLKQSQEVRDILQEEFSDIQKQVETLKEYQTRIQQFALKAQSVLFLKEFLPLLEEQGVELKTVQSIEFLFEFGPQYNDEGFDLGLTYDSFVKSVKFKEGFEGPSEKEDFNFVNEAFSEAVYKMPKSYLFKLLYEGPLRMDVFKIAQLEIKDVSSFLNMDENACFQDVEEILETNFSEQPSNIDYSNI